MFTVLFLTYVKQLILYTLQFCENNAMNSTTT